MIWILIDNKSDLMMWWSDMIWVPTGNLWFQSLDIDRFLMLVSFPMPIQDGDRVGVPNHQSREGGEAWGPLLREGCLGCGAARLGRTGRHRPPGWTPRGSRSSRCRPPRPPSPSPPPHLQVCRRASFAAEVWTAGGKAQEGAEEL